MSQGNNAGQSVGDAVKGVFNTAHGVGESLRGNFNNFVDQAGEGLASQMGDKNEQAERERKLAESNSGAKSGENANVAEQGKAEINKGLDQLSGKGSGANSGVGTGASSTASGHTGA